MTNRRSFIGSILALSMAPAIVRADSLMRIVPRETTFITFDSMVYNEYPLCSLDGKYLEQVVWTIEDVAKAFGVPVSMIVDLS